MGQTPNLRYLNHKDIGRILGPLDAYHDVGILREWLRSRFGTDHGLKELDSDAIATKSLSDLQIRESHCDVIISDLIQENYKSKKLFFTFNHPTIWLLEKIAERILAKAKIQVAIHPKFDNEPLGKIQPPDIFSIKNLSEARFLGVSNESKSKGCERLYSAESLKDAFFANYDGHREHLERFEKISFTPPY